MLRIHFKKTPCTCKQTLHLRLFWVSLVMEKGCGSRLMGMYIDRRCTYYILFCAFIVDVESAVRLTSRVCPVNSFAQNSHRVLLCGQVYLRWSSISTLGIMAPHLLVHGVASCLHVFRCAYKKYINYSEFTPRLPLEITRGLHFVYIKKLFRVYTSSILNIMIYTSSTLRNY